jgi:hypothetical protein
MWLLLLLLVLTRPLLLLQAVAPRVWSPQGLMVPLLVSYRRRSGAVQHTGSCCCCCSRLSSCPERSQLTSLGLHIIISISISISIHISICVIMDIWQICGHSSLCAHVSSRLLLFLVLLLLLLWLLFLWLLYLVLLLLRLCMLLLF